MQDAKQVAALLESGIQLKMLLVIPLYHVYGMVAVQCGVLAGGNMVVVLPKFEPHLFLSTIAKYKVV